VTTDPGRTGSNTISRAELGAYFKRRGHDHGGDAAAAVFDNIRAHRGPESEPAEAAPDRSALADAQNAIGQVIELAESWRMQGGQLDAGHVTGALLDICAPWTGMPVSELEAIGTGPLLDPDCRDGKHGSCVGAPCECPVPGVHSTPHEREETGHG
jgi:hypothetical protein